MWEKGPWVALPSHLILFPSVPSVETGWWKNLPHRLGATLTGGGGGGWPVGLKHGTCSVKLDSYFRKSQLKNLSLRKVAETCRWPMVGPSTKLRFCKSNFSRSAVPNLFGARDQFHGRRYFHKQGGEWLWDDSSPLCLVCTLLLLLLHLPQIIRQ